MDVTSISINYVSAHTSITEAYSVDMHRFIDTNFFTTEYFCPWVSGASSKFFVLGIIRPASLTVL